MHRAHTAGQTGSTPVPATNSIFLAAGNSNGACGVVRPAAVAPDAAVNSGTRGPEERAEILP